MPPVLGSIGEPMSNDQSVTNKVRRILIDFKHERVSLGDSMRKMKAIIYDTNNEFYYRGKVRKAIEYKMIGKADGEQS